MKKLLTLIFGMSALSVLAQSTDCQVILYQDSFAVTDTIRFDVKINTDSKLEVSVYASEKILHYSTDQLRTGDHAYRVLPGDARPGQYFILITGEGIREQRTFTLR